MYSLTDTLLLVQNLYLFLAQPNCLVHLDLSGTDCTVDSVSTHCLSAGHYPTHPHLISSPGWVSGQGTEGEGGKSASCIWMAHNTKTLVRARFVHCYNRQSPVTLPKFSMSGTVTKRRLAALAVMLTGKRITELFPPESSDCCPCWWLLREHFVLV